MSVSDLVYAVAVAVELDDGVGTKRPHFFFGAPGFFFGYGRVLHNMECIWLGGHESSREAIRWRHFFHIFLTRTRVVHRLLETGLDCSDY